jgi:hypothetical protein
MKKKVIGIAAVALLLGGSLGFAASSSPLVGAKVTGLFTVQKVDGTKIADAVVINGSTYVPIRAIGEATGTQITVEGKRVILQSKSGAAPVAIKETTQVTPTDLQTKKVSLEAEIEKKNAHIADLEKNVIPPLVAMAKELANNGTLGQDAQKSADDYKALLEQRKKELTFLQARLAEIKAQLGE